MAHEKSPDLPLIVVTGALKDEEAAALLEAGARDYVLKDRMARLPSAVEVALADVKQAQSRIKAEAAREASDELIRAIATSAQDAIVLMDSEGRISFWNPSAEKIFGFARDEALGRELHSLLAPERYKARYRNGVTKFRQIGQGPVVGQTFEIVARRKDGTEFPVEVSVSAIKLEHKWNAIGIVRDVTERKRAQEALKKSEANLREAQQIAAVGSWEWDLATDTHFWSEEESRILGRDPSLPAPNLKEFLAFVHPEDRKKVEDDANATFKTGTPFQTEYRIIRTDGEERNVESRGKRFDDADGKPIRLAGTIHDITERKQAEQALAQTNRALRTVSRGDEVLVHATSEEELLHEMCRVLVDVGGYVMAWIGFPEHDEAKTIRPVARAGRDDGYLEAVRVSWADTERGRGMTGTAIRTGEPQVNQDFATNPRMAPWRDDALKRGYASSVALPLKDISGVIGVLTIYAAMPDAFTGDELRLLVELAGDLSYGIGALRTRAEREKAAQQLQKSMQAIIEALASTVEVRDPYTAGHQRGVAKLAAAIGHEMGLPERDIEGIFLAGLVHDIGKINVPAEILSKPGKLTKIQFDLIKTHAQAGYDIVKGVDFPWPVAQMILQHHERLDGSGYPQGLTSDAILAGAKILAVADVVEAMTAHRPYRAALGLDAALAEIERGKGTIYDTAAADACINLFRNKGFHFQ